MNPTLLGRLVSALAALVGVLLTGHAAAADAPIHRGQDRKPEVISRPPSPFLDSVMRDGLGGTVIADFVVTKNGVVKHLKLTKASNPMLAFAAEESISHWRFKPALKDGRPVDERVRQEIAFHLPVVDVLALTGGIADTLPTPIHRVPPRYPSYQLQHGISGSVEVEFTVTTAGDVADAKVIRATNPGFNEAALECIRKWKLKPATLKGQPVKIRWRQEIAFSLGN